MDKVSMRPSKFRPRDRDLLLSKFHRPKPLCPTPVRILRWPANTNRQRTWLNRKNQFSGPGSRTSDTYRNIISVARISHPTPMASWLGTCVLPNGILHWVSLAFTSWATHMLTAGLSARAEDQPELARSAMRALGSVLFLTIAFQ